MTNSKKSAAEESLVTFVPAVSFMGFPDGKTKTQFTAGVESAPIPAEYLELLREKGFVGEGAGKAAEGKKDATESS